MWFKTYQKNGKKHKRQRYKCHDCGHMFQHHRIKKISVIDNLWDQYVYGHQTIRFLSISFKLSIKTIQNRLDNHKIKPLYILPGSSVIVMDTCYFKWGFGVMVFRDQKLKKNVYWKYVRYETLEEYRSGVNYLLAKGLHIEGIVCDGKRGLFNAFGDIPVQMCQFHQVAIITRYITRNPKLPAGIELKNLTHKLIKSTRIEFSDQLNTWHNRWRVFLKEKSYNEKDKKWSYTHRRLRSAYRSLKTNIEYIFTYLEYPDLDIPNTTNTLEGKFSRLKTKLRVHSGLKEWRKRRIINEILSK